jgi:hypothetical protein
MPNREDILRDLTHKDDGLPVGQRVFYTLAHDKRTQADRNSKALGLMAELLSGKGLIDEAELDDLLFRVAYQ